MRKKRLFLLLIACLWLFSAAFAQEIESESPAELITDRPGQTESSWTVPKKTLQIETGFLAEFDEVSEMKTQQYNTGTLLRYGAWKRFELRLGIEHSTRHSSIEKIDFNSKSSGLMPWVLGTKIALAKPNGWLPEIALMGHFEIPFSGKRDYSSDYLNPEIRLAALHTLSPRWALGYNAGVFAQGSTNEWNFLYSLVVGYSANPKIGLYAEAYGTNAPQFKSDFRIDGGMTFLLRHNLQLDLSGGIGISELAPDGFVGVGLSWRIPR